MQTDTRPSTAAFLLASRVATSVVPLAVLLLTWEFLCQRQYLDPLLFPPPTRIGAAFSAWRASGLLWTDVVTSYGRMLSGFALGATTGIALGLATGRSHRIDVVVSPVLQALRPLPPVAIIPLVIAWLGIGTSAKVFSTAFAVLFPVWISTHIGASTVSHEFIWGARVLGASQARTLFLVVLPAALPSMLAGLRTGISTAFVMVYVAELAGASSGLGYRIAVAHLAYRIDLMMAALATLAAAGALADSAFAGLVRLLVPWLHLRTTNGTDY